MQNTIFLRHGYSRFGHLVPTNYLRRLKKGKMYNVGDLQEELEIVLNSPDDGMVSYKLKCIDEFVRVDGGFILRAYIIDPVLVLHIFFEEKTEYYGLVISETEALQKVAKYATKELENWVVIKNHWERDLDTTKRLIAFLANDCFKVWEGEYIIHAKTGKKKWEDIPTKRLVRSEDGGIVLFPSLPSLYGQMYKLTDSFDEVAATIVSIKEILGAVEADAKDWYEVIKAKTSNLDGLQ